MSETASVPCNGCTHCCRNQIIMLMPNDGDVINDYEHRPIVDPLSGKPGFAVKQRKDGACTYLGLHGCTIHDRAPAICRAFDCRKMYLNIGSRRERKRLVRIGFVDKETLEMGRLRLDSLPK